jgi:aspartate kinase
MIVMKFGGSSLESANALARMTSIVSSQLERKPVVVVSAMGTTTDQLGAVSKDAERGHGYQVWKQIKELQEFHLNEAHRVVKDASMAWLEASLRRQFRDLHLLLLSVADEGRPLNPPLRDEVLSYGERLSSEVVTAAIQSSGMPAVHIDSRQVILTDGHHTQAQPLLWETYAKVRRIIPILGRDRVVVMGGFIGATEQGATTTMGRGGSDLTATLIGAGISAEEVQVWKDVDGMLTCDPKVMPGGYRLKTISYAEAAAMAKSGAKLLHPDTVSPVIRQRIPIVIRNSRRPDIEGTSIVPSAQSGTNPVKSISCKQDLTILELQSNMAGILESLCARHNVPVEFSAVTGSSFFLGVKNSTRLESLAASLESDLGCVEARVHSNSAVITLVGQGIISAPGLIGRVVVTLKTVPVVCIPDSESGLKLSLIVPQKVMQRSIELLHREFFQRVDPALFACVTDPAVAQAVSPAGPSTSISAVRPNSNQSAEIRSFPRAIQA